MQLTDKNGNVYGWGGLEIIGPDGKPKVIDQGLTSVGLSMPSAFTVSNSPLTSNGVIGVTGAGTNLEYIDGTGALRTFPSLTGYVPYTGATQNVNLGVYDITANSLIKAGGTSSQFLKADGSVDNSAYITLTSLSAVSPLNYNNLTGAFNIVQATTSTDGYLSSTDWNIFNNKQPAGNYITALSGEATASGPGTASVTLNNASVTAKVLTGVNVTGGSISASDSILTAFGKLQNQINGLIGSSIYQGTWDASTNTPALASGVGTRGYYYIVNVAGSTNLDGITDWNVGDWAIFDGTAWQQVDNTDSVTSVNGQTGAVSLTTDNITEGATNLYFTSLRARQSLTLTTSNSSGASTYDNTTGVLNIPNYGSALSGYVPYTGATQDVNLGVYRIASSAFVKAGGASTEFLKADGSIDSNTYLTTGAAASTYVPLSRTLTINGTAYDLSANRSWNVGTVTSVDMSVPTGFTVSGNPITGSGTLALGFNSDYSLPTIASQLEWDTAYDNMIVSASVTGTTTKTLTLNQQDGGTIVTSWTDYDTAPVTSVFGRTGAVVAQSGDYSTTLVTEGTNLYFTDARARASISLTTTGTSGAATYNSSTGVLNIPQYQSVITNPVTGTGTANYVARWTSSSQISTGVLYDNGTNVGIGTNNPASKLTLQASNNTYALELRNSLGDTRGGFFYDNISGTNTSLFMQSSVGTDVVVLRTSGTSYLNGGDVGIGTTSPSVKLDVVGTGHFGSPITSDQGLGIYSSNGFSSYSRIRFYQSSTNINTIHSFSTSWQGGTIYNSSAGALNLSGWNGITIGSWNDADAIFVAGGVSYFKNNVGIGTTTPSAKLHVDGTVITTSTLNDTDGSYAIDHPGINTWKIGVTSTNSSTFHIGNDTGGSFANKIFNITAAGLVGIGTTNPAGQLSGTKGLSIVDATNAALGLSNGTNHWLNYLSGTTYRIWNNTSSEVMTITLAGNVGIGTVTPARKLNVRVSPSAGGDDGIYIDDSAGDFLLTRTGASYTYRGVPANASMVYSNTALALLSDSPSSRISFHNNSGEYARFTSAGNLGIGNTDPAVKLAVSGVTSTGNRRLSLGILDLNSGDTPNQIRINTTIPFNSPSADFTVNIKGFRYGAPQMVSLSIGWHYYLGSFFNETAISNGAWKPTISLAQDAGGFVVIHLSSPAYWPKLYVESVYSSAYGDIYSSGWNWTDANLSNCTNVEVVPYQALATDITGNAGSTSAVSGTTNYVSKFTSSTTIGNSLIYDNGTNVGIGTTSPAHLLNINSSVTNDRLSFSHSGSVKAIFGVTNGGDFYLYNNSSLTFPLWVNNVGNLGIGTTNPYEALDINGNIRLGNYTTAGTRYIGYANNTFANQFIAGMSIESTTVGGNYSQRLNFVTHNYGVNVGVRMTIAENGNVGIGTTSPNRKLTVAGEISSNYGSNQGALWLGEIALQNASFTSYGVLDFTMHNGGGFSDVMRIQGNGRVGIGTTSPLRKLDVSGGHDDTTAILYASGSWGTASLDMWASEPGITLEGSGIGNNVNSSPYYGRRTTAYGQSYLRFILGEITFSTGATTASEMMRIRTNGNVGIGTTNPSNKFVVSDNGGIGLEFNPNYLGEAYIASYNRSSSSYGNLNFEANNIFFRTSGAAALRGVIDSSGNFGIGTTAPVYKLDVIGIGKFGDHALIGSGVPQGYYQDSLNGAYRGTNGSGDKGFYFQSYNGINTSAFVGIEGTYAARIGIGNSAPATALHISKGNESYTLYGPNASWGAYLWVGAGPDKISNGSAQVISTNGNLHLDSGTGQDTYINSYSQRPTLINPQGGNVAVGTFDVNSYPYAAKFNVNGSISSSGGKIGFGVTDAFTLNGIDTAHYGMSSNMNLVQLSGYYGLVFATTGAERMRITDGGNLGVGTTSPLYKTTIYNGPTNTDVLCISNDQIQGGSFAQNFVGISLQDQYANGGGNVSVIRSYSNLYQQWGSALVFGTTGNTGNGVIERMVINPEGNVGINTSIFSPTEKLEVNGNINISPRSFTPGFLSFYNDLAGQPPFITNFSGVRWGYKNGDPGFPPVATDMSIINNPSLAGYFGSIMSFKIQPYVVPGPSFTDSQVDKLNLVPYNFFTGTGGVGINTISPQASLHVYENGGFPPPYRSDYRAAKFEWDFGGVVFPNVPEDNKNMIPGEPGMVIFNTTVAKLQVFDGTNWVNLH